MGSTAIHAYPYPEGSDQPVVHQDLKAVADDIDQDTFVPCLSSARPAHLAGRRIFETDTFASYVSTGSAWIAVAANIAEWEYIDLIGPTPNNAEATASYTNRPLAVGVTATAALAAAKVTITTAGRYQVSMAARFEAGTVGERAIVIDHRDAGDALLHRFSDSKDISSKYVSSVGGTIRCEVGHTLTPKVYTSTALTVDNSFKDNHFLGMWLSP